MVSQNHSLVGSQRVNTVQLFVKEGSEAAGGEGSILQNPLLGVFNHKDKIRSIRKRFLNLSFKMAYFLHNGNPPRLCTDRTTLYFERLELLCCSRSTGCLLEGWMSGRIDSGAGTLAFPSSHVPSGAPPSRGVNVGATSLLHWLSIVV